MRIVRRSLKRAVLINLIPPILLLAGAIALGGYFTIANVVETAHDRLLDGSLMAIAERLALEDGEVTVDMPQVALGMLESKAQDSVYYLVSANGAPVTGYADLPLGRLANAKPGDTVHWDDVYRGNPVRLGAVARRVYGVEPPVIVAVAETRIARDQLRREMLRNLGLAEAALIAAIALLAWFSVERGLKPLADLSSQIDARVNGDWRDLRPLDLAEVPEEALAPASAMNALFERLRSATEIMRRFTADASHQIRTPLAIVRMHVDLLRRSPDDANARAQAIAEVDQGAARLERLIQQLLALARIDEGAATTVTQTPFDLAESIEAIVGERIAGTPPHIQMSCDIDARPLLVMSDPVLLAELIGNLVDNALKYSGERGEVVVRARREADGVIVEIEDSGPGIPQDEREKAFERFYRVPGRNAAPGSGLGLAIVKAIADLLNVCIVLGDSATLGGLKASVHVCGRQMRTGSWD